MSQRRIGFAIAKRLGEEGSTVFVSSRKEANVNESVKKLKDLGLDVYGTTCHVGKAEDRKKLIDLVSVTSCLLLTVRL